MFTRDPNFTLNTSCCNFLCEGVLAGPRPHPEWCLMCSDRLSRGCDKLNNGFISIMSGCDEPVGLTLSKEQAGDGGSPVLAEGHDKDVIRTE